MSEILVVGASGAVGRFLLPRLRATGAGLVALSRQAQADVPGLRWLRGGLDAQLTSPPVDTIVCIGPLDLFADWLAGAATPALRRVVALSSMSADSKRESQDPAERALAARLAAAEQRLAQRCDDAGVAWTVIRPTLIYGAGMDRSLSPVVRWALRTRLFPVIAGATGVRQPVHADDVAAACVAALTGAAAGRVVPLGGGERLSYAQMLARVRAGLGRSTFPLPLPIGFLRLVTRVTGRGGGMVQRLKQDLVADNASAQSLLGLHPRDFRPGSECWQADDGVRARRDSA
ncbi:MAG TPA: NAD-dependent epimerase/dehydratase family protein [Tahibacter sp.]|nr:NAD-dependent epimerase/dehydratase family protein [Tahibacter sp.]